MGIRVNGDPTTIFSPFLPPYISWTRIFVGGDFAPNLPVDNPRLGGSMGRVIGDIPIIPGTCGPKILL